MKRHRISTKPFQKRVEDMVKNLEASFKQEDSLTRKEIIFYVVFCIGIGIGLNLNLIMMYVGYPLDLCGLTLLGNALYEFCKGFVQGFVQGLVQVSVSILYFVIPIHVIHVEMTALMYKNGTIAFYLTFFLLIPIVT